MTFRFRDWMGGNVAPTEFGFDYADLITFNSEVVELPSFDQRSLEELDLAALSAATPMARERAIWELAYRPFGCDGARLRKYFNAENDARVRANLLWLARKVVPSEAVGLLEHALEDTNPEVRDWARLHLSEIRGESFESEYEYGTYVVGRAFDQTLPLEIAGFAVMPFGERELRVVLSPLWFAHIQGRVMACTRDETFMSRLTIEKRYAGLHPDGSDHYEIYPFVGKSWHSSELDVEHRYVTKTRRPFYFSGRVEENPGHAKELDMIAARVAQTTGRLLQVYNHEAGAEVQGHSVERRVVSHVKGQYFGWAHASLTHYVEHGDILPGTVQLISPTDPELFPLVNCYICGTFRGKLADHNGDGLLDVNEVICHGSEDGKLDYRGDGAFAADPFA
jgi:hypothetical protein